MNYKQHGNIATVLILVSFGIAGTSIYNFGTVLALLLYIGLVIAGLGVVLFSYCRKCYKVNNDCVHLNVGSLTRFMPDVSMDKYSLPEKMGAFLPMIAITIFPQFWLIQDLSLFITYWVLSIVAVTEILTFVCNGCKNKLCMFCRNRT